MGFRRFMAAAALVVCGTGLMAGCPNVGGLVDSLAEGLSELDLDQGSDPGTQVPDGSKPGGGVLPGTTQRAIPDGAYEGTKNASTGFWQNGAEYWTGDWSEELVLNIADGAIVVPFGGALRVGDADTLDFGDLQISRVVDEIDPWDGGVDVYYQLTATWGGIQFRGSELVEHVANSDGSVTLYDQISLTSLDFVKGVRGWEIEVDGEAELTAGGVLVPGTPTNPGSPLDDDILDKKSGKIRR